MNESYSIEQQLKISRKWSCSLYLSQVRRRLASLWRRQQQQWWEQSIYLAVAIKWNWQRVPRRSSEWQRHQHWRVLRLFLAVA